MEEEAQVGRLRVCRCRDRGRSAILPAFVQAGAVITVVLVVAVAGSLESEHLVMSVAGISCGIGAAAAMSLWRRGGRAGTRAVWAFAAVMQIAAALAWGWSAVGQYPFDAGMKALSRQDYTRAAHEFSRALAAFDAPGSEIGLPLSDLRLRLSTKGLVWYEQWETAMWMAVATYGTGEEEAAIDMMNGARMLAESSGADAASLGIIQDVLERMKEGREEDAR